MSKRPLTNKELQKGELKYLDKMCSWADKRQVGYAYYCIGLTNPEVLSNFLNVTHEQVIKWMPEYEEAFALISKEQVKFLVGHVTENDKNRWQEIQNTQNKIIDDLNEELKIEDKLNEKILKHVNKLMDEEDLNSEQIAQSLAILKHFKDKDRIRKEKVNLLLVTKREFAKDSGIETELELRKERTKTAEKIFISEKIEEYKQDRKSGKPITEQAYHAKLNEANKETKKFLEVNEL